MKALIGHLVAVAFLLTLASPLSSCSAKKESTVSSEVTTTERARFAGEEPERVVVETRTETEETDSQEGGLFQIAGDIIALPFRAIGALFSAIF